MLLCGLYDGAEQLHGRFTGVLLLSSEVRDLVKALVPVLDGRTDKAMPQQSLDPYESTRYYLSPENVVVMQLKQAIMRVVSTRGHCAPGRRVECKVSICLPMSAHAP